MTHEQIRCAFWAFAWAVASKSELSNSHAYPHFADQALAEFDKRFPAAKTPEPPAPLAYRPM